jgi:NADPH:quinone reductase-like Zn-dependent oxidoreductase
VFFYAPRANPSIMTTALPPTMLAMAIADGALSADELPLPVAAAGEVLIRVTYVGVNRADILQIEGNYAPPVGASPLPGLEISGWVAKLGTGVDGFMVGDTVCALLSGGGYAQYVAVPAGQVLPVPRGANLKTAASLPEAAATSLMALMVEGRLQKGGTRFGKGEIGVRGWGLGVSEVYRRYSMP